LSHDTSVIIEKLREHEVELKAAGIVVLSVFGSVARGDATAQSDVDLMGDFDQDKDLSVFDLAGLKIGDRRNNRNHAATENRVTRPNLVDELVKVEI
jgi:predicted nucleotidyltransferase